MTNWNCTDLDAAYEIEEKRAHRQQMRAKFRRCLPWMFLAVALALGPWLANWIGG